jgi:signal transduction protein with GAF and PtsI domain
MPACFKHFVQLVANVFDSLTSALFVRDYQSDVLILLAWESLSPHIITECNIKVGQGFIGWVARERKRLHVTQFDRDTKTLGIYSRDVGIKAFLAAPLPRGEGVLMVDSKNRYFFSEKKQRILENFATIASDFLSFWKGYNGLQLYHRWYKWHCELSGEIEHILTSLIKLLRLKNGLVAFYETDKNFFIVKATVGLPKKIMSENQYFDLKKGLVGWLLRHKKHLILSRFGANRHKSYLLRPDEPFDRGPVVIGLFQPIETGALVWVLTGDADLSVWPEGFADLLIFSLDRMINNNTRDFRRCHGT